MYGAGLRRAAGRDEWDKYGQIMMNGSIILSMDQCAE
jgi:hypothetical protein